MVWGMVTTFRACLEKHTVKLPDGRFTFCIKDPMDLITKYWFNDITVKCSTMTVMPVVITTDTIYVYTVHCILPYMLHIATYCQMYVLQSGTKLSLQGYTNRLLTSCAHLLYRARWGLLSELFCIYKNRSAQAAACWQIWPKSRRLTFFTCEQDHKCAFCFATF